MEWKIFSVGIEQADDLCVKLNDLIKRGKISKERIFYKYPHDVVEFFYNQRHEYDPDVVEYFNTLTYLGGRRTANMLRGPMFTSQGRGSNLSSGSKEFQINLGGPSESTCNKRQAGYRSFKSVSSSSNCT